MMEALKWVLITIGVVGALFGGFLIYSTLNDYSPPEIVSLTIDGSPTYKAPTDKITVLTWNIGYAGLGKNMDFFMDGGKRVKDSKENSLRNLKGIMDIVEKYSTVVDIYMFQEVDIDSDRTYHINEYSKLKEILNGYSSVFAYNFHVDFVPVPINSPIGRVRSGVAVFSRYKFYEPLRLSLPGEYSWPVSIFHLDRCMIKLKIPASNGKYWVLFNTHNSAYDEGGVLRKKQLEFIKKQAMEEYEKGNYVIIGGDWNSIIPGKYSYKFQEATPSFYVKLPDNWTPKGWKWTKDEKVPTNRSLATPYIKDKTFVTTIDGFLVSPNVKVVESKVIDLGFEYSDHNPVLATFSAKK